MSVLRPACLGDVFELSWTRDENGLWDRDADTEMALRNLYDAEWRKRGFQRSP